MKPLIGSIAVILVFIGYIPYLRDILKGRTIPHLYSWFLWGFVTTIVFFLQMSDNAGSGGLVTLAAAAMCVVVFLLGLAHKGKRDITGTDTVFLLLALAALGIWLVAKQPMVSAMLATLIDLLGFVPTIRKSWHKPHSETVSFYALNTFRFGLAMFALERYSLITALYPLTWMAANGLFALMLVYRRRRVPSSVPAV